MGVSKGRSGLSRLRQLQQSYVGQANMIDINPTFLFGGPNHEGRIFQEGRAIGGKVGLLPFFYLEEFMVSNGIDEEGDEVASR